MKKLSALLLTFASFLILSGTPAFAQASPGAQCNTTLGASACVAGYTCSTSTFTCVPNGTTTGTNIIQIQPQAPSQLQTPSNIQDLVNKVIRIFFIVGGVMVVVMLLWGGVEWILSGGNKEKVGAARGKIINALIGLVVLALAFLIAKFVGGAIGFDPFNTPNLNITNNAIPVQNQP